MLRLNSLCHGTGNQFDHNGESIRGKQGINCDNRESIPFAAMKHLFRAVSLTRAGRSRASVATDNYSAYTKRGAGRRTTLARCRSLYYTEDASVLQAPSDDVTEKWEIIRI